MEQGMASHIAVLSMIAALGMPGVDAAHWHHARAHPGLPGGFSQAREFAPAPKDMDTRDVSRDDMIGSDTMAQSAGPDMPGGRPPVPFFRQPRPVSTSPVQPETPEAAAEDEPEDALDMEAAKAAIERDGYKRVRILDKADNGGWRAKAYRGVAEVLLKVDSHGGVSAE
jgi:hypothetical protein